MNTILGDPALWIGLIRATMILLVSFGVALNDAQMAAVIAFAVAFMAVASMLLTLVTRRTTTPKADPQIPQGTAITVITPAGQPNYQAVA